MPAGFSSFTSKCSVVAVCIGRGRSLSRRACIARVLSRTQQDALPGTGTQPANHNISSNGLHTTKFVGALGCCLLSSSPALCDRVGALSRRETAARYHCLLALRSTCRPDTDCSSMADLADDALLSLLQRAEAGLSAGSEKRPAPAAKWTIQPYAGVVTPAAGHIEVTLAFEDANSLRMKVQPGPVHPAFKEAVLDAIPTKLLRRGHLIWLVPWSSARALKAALSSIPANVLGVSIHGIQRGTESVLASVIARGMAPCQVQALLKSAGCCAAISAGAASPGETQPPEATEPLDIPSQLSAKLRSFQEAGVQFAVARGGRVLIGDEMGTGKTCQALTVARHFWRDWPALVLLPSSLRWVWCGEVACWLPELQQDDVAAVSGDAMARGVLQGPAALLRRSVPSTPGEEPLPLDTTTTVPMPALSIMSYTLFRRWTEHVWAVELSQEQRDWCWAANSSARQKWLRTSKRQVVPAPAPTSPSPVVRAAYRALVSVSGNVEGKGASSKLGQPRAPAGQAGAVGDGSTIGGGAGRGKRSGKPSLFFTLLGKAVAACAPTLICDEAHYLRDISSQRTAAAVAVAVAAKRVLFLTGTPAFARPVDIFPLLHSLAPQTFRAKHSFGVRYCDGSIRTLRVGGGRRAERGGWEMTTWVFDGASQSKELYAFLTEALMIRRLKQDVLTQLPPKQRQLVQLTLEGPSPAPRMQRALDKEVSRIAALRHDQWLARAVDSEQRRTGGLGGAEADLEQAAAPHLSAAKAAGISIAGTGAHQGRDLTSFFTRTSQDEAEGLQAPRLQQSVIPPGRPDEIMQTLLDAGGVPMQEEYTYDALGESVGQAAHVRGGRIREDAGGLGDSLPSHAAGAAAAVQNLHPAGGHAGESQEDHASGPLDPTAMDRWQATGIIKAPLVAQYLLASLGGGGPGQRPAPDGSNKHLVFAHHQSVLDTLQGELVKAGIVYVRIDGACSLPERQECLRRFQRDAAVEVALVSMTAGGEGLCYTAAAVVVFAELHYVPGIMLQAEDRAHRLSSVHREAGSPEFDNGGRVTVKYMLASGSFDEEMWPRVVRRLHSIGVSVNGAEIDLDTSFRNFEGKGVSEQNRPPPARDGSASPCLDTTKSSMMSSQGVQHRSILQTGGVFAPRAVCFRVDAVTGTVRVYTRAGHYTGLLFDPDNTDLAQLDVSGASAEPCCQLGCVVADASHFQSPAPEAVLAAAGLRSGSAEERASPGMEAESGPKPHAVRLPLPHTRPQPPASKCTCWRRPAAAFAQEWSALAALTQRDLCGPLLSLPLATHVQLLVRQDLGLLQSEAAAAGGGGEAPAKRYATLSGGVAWSDYAETGGEGGHSVCPSSLLEPKRSTSLCCAHCGMGLRHALALSVVGEGAQALIQPSPGSKRSREEAGNDVPCLEDVAEEAKAAGVSPEHLVVLPFCGDKCSKAYWGRRRTDRIREYVGGLELGVCQLCGIQARQLWRHVQSLHRSRLQTVQTQLELCRTRLRRLVSRAEREEAEVEARLLEEFPHQPQAVQRAKRACVGTLKALVGAAVEHAKAQAAAAQALRQAAQVRAEFMLNLDRKAWTASPRGGQSWPCAFKAREVRGWHPRARDGDVVNAPGLVEDPREGSFWQVDHIRPVVEGGGGAGWGNLRTLCSECHREATAALRRRMAVLGKAASSRVLDTDDLIAQAVRSGDAPLIGTGIGRGSAAAGQSRLLFRRKKSTPLSMSDLATFESDDSSASDSDGRPPSIVDLVSSDDEGA